MADFLFENHGSIWLVRPQNEEARQHLEDHTAEDAQWLGNALAVEHRYVPGLAEGLNNEGYSVA